LEKQQNAVPSAQLAIGQNQTKDVAFCNEPFDVAVLTSAALPWLTGPALISLWQACGLASLGYRVAYVVPWLDARSQQKLWGACRFPDFQAQVAWLTQEAEAMGCAKLPYCVPYKGRYSKSLRSIIPIEDVFAAAPPAKGLVACEPEHLSWFPFTRGRSAIKAEKTVGLCMTNYDHFIRQSGLPLGSMLLGFAARFHGRAIRRRMDIALRLSPAMNVRGVQFKDMRVTGVTPAYARVPPVDPTNKNVYYLGGFVWGKGLADLVAIAERAGQPIDAHGVGPDERDIRDLAKTRRAPIRFFGPNARFWNELPRYRVFVNPSRSEVLCTATAEALVAGRHVVLPQCPGNLPFEGYPNTFFYRDLDGAVEALNRALSAETVVPDAARNDFDWTQACRRLAGVCGLPLNPGSMAHGGHTV
jgi:digalactosyldiacylglycerol synthase